MVTIRIRSWRPAMPSISGPRSTVASNFTVTPFVSGATCSLFIVHSSPDFEGLMRQLSHPPAEGIGHQLLVLAAFFSDLQEHGSAATFSRRFPAARTRDSTVSWTVAKSRELVNTPN